MKKLKFIGIILLGAIFLHSCASADELRSSPTTININGSILSLDVSVWRDFMPPTENNGKPMTSTIHLNLISGPDILSNIHLVRQYVIYGNEIWAADLFFIGINGSFIEATSSGGPKWGPNVLVDVVLEFTYANQMYRIQAPLQNIELVQ